MQSTETKFIIRPENPRPEERLRLDGLSLTEVVGRLNFLENSQAGAHSYYQALAKQNSNELLAAAGICALLDLDRLPPDLWALAVGLSRYNGVRGRAFGFFVKHFEHELARRAATAPQAVLSDLQAEIMLATLELDHARLVDLNRLMFLETGLPEYLGEAADAAEARGGWQEALPWAVCTVLAKPLDRRGGMRLFRLLKHSNQFDLLRAVGQVFDRAQIFPAMNILIKATLAQHEERPQEALNLLSKIDRSGADSPLLHRIICKMTAECHESLGEFSEAARWYAEQNKVVQAGLIDPDRFFDGARRRARLAVPDLPEDARNCHLMLGFPRSGPTLLEAALSAHPRIETFEEIPSFSIMVTFIMRRMRGGNVDLATALEGRRRYYAEIDRQRTKRDATILVDKLPIISAEAAFLRKMFPQKRYVFSIRHPYDVVLSCFKQPFQPNPAMENFRTIEMSFRAYDLTMRQWFDHFSLEDERVCYVRYENLVEDFRAQVSRVLQFLGTEWVEEVLEFPAVAERRKVATPSYQKVRSGLSLGVQSSWRSYDFFFRLDEARLLNPWLKHFGYEGL